MLALPLLLLASRAEGMMIKMDMGDSITGSSGPDNPHEFKVTSEATHEQEMDDGNTLFMLPLWTFNVFFKSPWESNGCPIEYIEPDKYIEIDVLDENFELFHPDRNVFHHRYTPTTIGLLSEDNAELLEKELGTWMFRSPTSKCGELWSDDSGFPVGFIKKKNPNSCEDLSLLVDYQIFMYECTPGTGSWRQIERIVGRNKEGKTPVKLLWASKKVTLDYKVAPFNPNETNKWTLLYGSGFPPKSFTSMDDGCGHKFGGRLKGKAMKQVRLSKGADACECQGFCAEKDGAKSFFFSGGKRPKCSCYAEKMKETTAMAGSVEMD